MNIRFLLHLFLIFSFVFGFLYATSVRAFDPTDGSLYGGLAVKEHFGAVDSVDSGLVLTGNILRYAGWIGTIVGVLAVTALTIFKLIGTDNSETLKEVQGWMVKAVLISVFGVLLLSAGIFISIAEDLTGQDVPVLGE